ncbi:hypothetical protein BLA29_003901, partial [Euroglyphus maynei]
MMESENNNEFKFESDTISLEDIRQQVTGKTVENSNVRNSFLDLFDSVAQISSKFRGRTDNDCKVGLPEWTNEQRHSLEMAINLSLKNLIKLSDDCQIDLSDAIIKKMAKNKQKYPVDKSYNIIISGFRSYKYCLINDLSPGLNVIVGSNGSGKSNIVMALEFVLTQNYNHLGEQQRLLLMCQNQSANESAKTIEAFVEIHFDNVDKFFPINEQLVVIKRQITRTSDNFYINGRLAKNDELMAFLESGGFSRDNSYFIVKQGLVSDIATSNPRNILDILRCMS